MVSKRPPTSNLYKAENGQVSLYSPTLLPLASSYLYNQHMLAQVNCRGYVNAQFMQPEPSKYSRSPTMEATSFIQPEQNFFAHSPGRFFYFKNRHTGELFSVPYEPCRVPLKSFEFACEKDEITWFITHEHLAIELRVSLAEETAAEIWSISITNNGDSDVSYDMYPYFSIGYLSWMYQETFFDETLNAIVSKTITPYQKLEDHYKNKSLKDCTYLLADRAPNSWQCRQLNFEGDGGLHNPSATSNGLLTNNDARYEPGCGVLQYSLALEPGQQETFRFAFGPAQNKREIADIKNTLFDDSMKGKLDTNSDPRQQFPLTVTSDIVHKDYLNHWLPNQMKYHGDLQRLSTDPQFRNYLQDAMGSTYLTPDKSRQAFITALSQQSLSGQLPEGVLLNDSASLKYINQVPHADASIWVPICLLAYLNETNDFQLLVEPISFSDSEESAPLHVHVERALSYLLEKRDYRGLCFIEQGDWCDPMNMVGHQGKGVSSWLSMALSYALQAWLEILEHYGSQNQLAEKQTQDWDRFSQEINSAINTHCWHQDWYGRGITDNDDLFGTMDDKEGQIFLNPQSWAILCGAASTAKQYSMLNAVEQRLNTPYGVMMLAPSYTEFRDDIGRITQKYPGVSENGSVYNHAAAFYAYSLYQIGQHDSAFNVLTKMLPTEKDVLLRGQLPNFIPNYYRGAYYQFPEHAGRSSQLINTGTISWFYRCIIEELCGLKGQRDYLIVEPKLPDSLQQLCGTRIFRGAILHFKIEKAQQLDVTVSLDGVKLKSNRVKDLQLGKNYQLDIRVPV
ncbi:GH36-type glycosyl hydrolase domain-containing protein [Thalassotalea euphylliae]|uniref:GH36-type glycosyl hydrolase domain-containing protein n=1 Tax=Thalassotalea euphylliae TaxID=1655234 RepID=UPI00363EC278